MGFWKVFDMNGGRRSREASKLCPRSKSLSWCRKNYRLTMVYEDEIMIHRRTKTMFVFFVLTQDTPLIYIYIVYVCIYIYTFEILSPYLSWWFLGIHGLYLSLSRRDSPLRKGHHFVTLDQSLWLRCWHVLLVCWPTFARKLCNLPLSAEWPEHHLPARLSYLLRVQARGCHGCKKGYKPPYLGI